MENKPEMELKPMKSDNPDTSRILETTRKSIENLNLYVQDFFETTKIMQENLEKATRDSDTNKADELKKNIMYIETKIGEVTEFMKKIAEEMSSFVNLKM